MECTCQIDGCWDGDTVEMLRQSFVTAKKNFKCAECGNPINPKDKYHLDVYVCDGEIFNHRICLSCENIRDVLFCSYRFDALMEDLWVEIQEYGIPESCISKLTKNARAVVCKMIEEHWENEN